MGSGAGSLKVLGKRAKVCVVLVDAVAVRRTARCDNQCTRESCDDEFFHFMPKNLPSLARRPVRESGIPVAREIFRFAAVIPSARFQENVSPGPNFMSSTVSVPFLEIRSVVVAAGEWG